jgi:effector-binding domain-containing protein
LSEVRELVVEARPTAVVAETTTWEEYPRVWGKLLDEVWQAVRSSGAITAGRNVMLYKDDRPSVEVGVEAGAPFEAIGRVVPSALPAGRVLTTTHRGPFEELGASHDAVVRECERLGLERVGPCWEIYGHQGPGPEIPEVEIYHLVRP